ncbi:MAG: molybdopterin-dependent oxidoreductase [Myxococcales bacterium]|nr:molybdopterin-dependent oxidoreductase [Myxococcales bacterium]MCB9628990.1 molybdopterin-dependent oxidoreductase [Sandaracinaceae bacterium]
MSTPTLHHRTCSLCEAMCGITLEVHANKVLATRGDERDPFSQGHICPKATALSDLHDDPDRLRQPMRRERGGFTPISWDEALNEAAERIHGLQQRHGNDAMAAYLGNPNIHNMGAMLFGPVILRALRSKNRFSATSVDQLPHMFAAYHMFGHQLLLPVPDVDRTDFLLMLGANPLASNGSLMSAPGIRRRLDAIRARGGEVVLMDPRRTESARSASEHHFIRPGSDALFLLSLLHVVFARDAVKLGNVQGLTRGLDELRAVAKDFSPAFTAVHTGVSVVALESIASRLLAARRAAVYGRMGASTQRFGGLCAWLVYALNAVTGNLDREGGAMFTQPALDSLKAAGGFGVGRGSHGRWRSRVRGLPEFGGELPVAVLAEEILTAGTGQIRGLLTMAGNPVLSTPNGAQLDRALAKLDLMISVDPYINETTRHAHLILPPLSPLERPHYDLALHLLAVRNTAKFSEPTFTPPAGALDDWQVHVGIARRLAALRNGRLDKEVLRLRALETTGPERMLDVGLRMGPYGSGANLLRDGLTLKKLRENPHGEDFGALQPCLRERLPDAHGYVELAPAPMIADLERLRASMGEEAQTLQLVGRRHVRSNNSWLHNSERLMKGRDRCTALLNPVDAARAGVAQGAQVTLRSRTGEITLSAELTDDIMPGVVSVPHGFGHARDGVQLRVASEYAGVSVNDLTDELLLDTLTGNAVLNGVPVELSLAGDAKGESAAS